MWDLRKNHDNTAFQDEYGNVMTYGGLDETSEKIYEKMAGRSLVFILCTNSIGSVAGYVSCIQNRVVPLLLNAHMEDGLLEELIKTYDPEYIWHPKERRIETGDSEKIFSAHGYNLTKRAVSRRPELYDELALLLTTSGSTGSPKFVRQSYKNILSNAESIADYLHLNESERPITTLPMNYTYGLSIINSHLLCGATILLTDRSITQREFWKFFREAGPTSFGGVPYTYEMLDRMRFFNMSLPSLKTMTQAGGKLSPELHKRFAEYSRDRDIEFVIMYGQCEATARMSYLPPQRALDKVGSVGIAIPGGRFSVVDEDGSEITDPGNAGELVFYGDNVTLGYAERPEDLMLGDERNGILRTGDVAKTDEEGFYYIVGRKKRFLKIYGNRVNLDEVDSLIKSSFADMDIASSGKDDHMMIFITDEKRSEEVRDFISLKTGLNKAAFEVVTVPEIPKNEAGKIMYSRLEDYR